MHLLKKQAVGGLVGPLGRVEKVDLHAKNSSSVEYVRALVWINTEEPLQFRRIARFKSREVVPTELEYEKLIKVCFTCKRLTHDQLYCPLQGDITTNVGGSRERFREASRTETQSGSSRQRDEGPVGRGITKRGQRGGKASKSDKPPQRTTNPIRRREGERKGKNMIGETSQVWLPESTQSLPLKGVGGSRSTEESSANPKSMSNSQGKMGAGASSGASQDSPSVFNRLSGFADVSPRSRPLPEIQRSDDRPSLLGDFYVGSS